MLKKLNDFVAKDLEFGMWKREERQKHSCTIDNYDVLNEYQDTRISTPPKNPEVVDDKSYPYNQ